MELGGCGVSLVFSFMHIPMPIPQFEEISFGFEPFVGIYPFALVITFRLNFLKNRYSLTVGLAQT